MQDSPQRRFATQGVRHTNVTREFERKRRTNVCNSADVEDSPHNNDRLRSGRDGWMGVGVRGLGSRELGGGGRGIQLPDPSNPNPTLTSNPRIFCGKSSMWRILWQPFQLPCSWFKSTL